MRLNIPHKKSRDKLFRRLQKQLRPPTAEDIYRVICNGIGNYTSARIYQANPLNRMDKRQRRRHQKRVNQSIDRERKMIDEATNNALIDALTYGQGFCEVTTCPPKVKHIPRNQVLVKPDDMV